MSGEADRAPAWTLYRPSQRWGFLGILFLASASSSIDRHVMSVLIEPIKAEFHASDTVMGLLGGFAFAALYATLGLPVARFADRGDRKLVISAALAVWSIMTLLCGMARTLPELVLARVGVGAGEAGAMPPAQSLIADYFPPDQRARALGVFISSSTAGYLLAFTLGAWLAATHGWRSAFVALGAPGLLLCVLTLFGLREPRLRTQKDQRPQQESLRTTLAALAGKRTFVLLCVATILYFLVAYGAVIWFPSYLVRVLHLDLVSVGAIFGALGAVASLVGSVFGGLITDFATRRGGAYAARVPSLIMIGVVPFYELALFSNEPVLFYAASFVGAVGLSAAVPAFFTLLHRICGSPRRSMAVAILFFFANLVGLGLGPVLTGVLSDHFSAAYGPVGLRYSLMIAFAALVLSGMALWAAATSVERDTED
ncbi:MFS transporter [Sphingomonas sp. SM33]|uniref:MFS transporter n=1 Tax=Sphingomonas telluris TaxID=2907998 RepID=A0ABS9VNR7_9SPHN|nr:MFS transporter [Sphingomonas telluris]MCH8616620.1 MFS transporter [Sphingomonas telluris]